MANILIISALQIFPVVSGGHQRTASIAQELAKAGHHVRIYSLIGRKRDMLRFKGRGEAVISSHLREFVRRPFTLWAKAMIAYKRGIPPLWAKESIEQPDTTLGQWIEQSDIIIYDFPYTYGRLNTSRKLQILNSHNIEHRLFRTKDGRDSHLTETVRKLEHRAIAGVDLVVCASSEENQAFSQAFPTKLLLHIPNSITPRMHPLLKANQTNEIRHKLGINEHDTVLLFPASRYGPNIEGMDFLRNFSMEHDSFLQKEGIVILVVGSVSNSRHKIGQFLTTGPVDDIKPYFYIANWGINPIFYGSGTSIKVAEFIGYDLPILTTEIGSRGFSFDDAETAIFFTQDTLLDKLKHLPKDPNLLTKMRRGARAANAQFLDSHAAVVPLLQAISSWKPPS